MIIYFNITFTLHDQVPILGDGSEDDGFDNGNTTTTFSRELDEVDEQLVPEVWLVKVGGVLGPWQNLRQR